jgi:alginate O-acetyltransferase complex protein AlgI
MIIDTLVSTAIVLILWSLAWHLRSVTTRQALLLAASYLFYAGWGLDFLFVLVASSLMNYAWGLVLRWRATAVCLSAGVLLNLLLLGFFKYLPSLLALASAGSGQPAVLRDIVMPVGISFWTFQGLSYLFDIYRDEETDPSLLEFCLYMAFWPTVLSGPICRLPNLLPQFRKVVGFTWENFSAGLCRLSQGLLMKLVLAQLLGSGLNSGEGVAAGFDPSKENWGGVDVWLLGIGFGFQLFFDFAGYSHIMIGSARLFGIRLAENFDRPYFSTTPSLFWTRWHMSLSFWIRDYVFWPLAGLWRDRRWPYVTLLISMALFGLWHGAKATFIIWGIYHGLLLVLHRLGQQATRRLSFRSPVGLGALLSWSTTFSLISLGWILFRAHDPAQALDMLRAVVSLNAYSTFTMPDSFYILIATVVGGYFIYGAVELWLVSWSASQENKLASPVQPALHISPLAQLIEFYAVKQKRWTLSVVFAMAIYTVLAILDQRDRLAIPAFMYTGF